MKISSEQYSASNMKLKTYIFIISSDKYDFFPKVFRVNPCKRNIFKNVFWNNDSVSRQTDHPVHYVWRAVRSRVVTGKSLETVKYALSGDPVPNIFRAIRKPPFNAGNHVYDIIILLL